MRKGAANRKSGCGEGLEISVARETARVEGKAEKQKQRQCGPGLQCLRVNKQRACEMPKSASSRAKAKRRRVLVAWSAATRIREADRRTSMKRPCRVKGDGFFANDAARLLFVLEAQKVDAVLPPPHLQTVLAGRRAAPS